MARLIIVESGRRRIYDICEDVVRIGSASDNNIELSDPSASKSHCEIRRTADGFKLLDLESKQGTAVNGAPVNHKLLDSGDKIRIGKAVMLFEAAQQKIELKSRPVSARARRSRDDYDDDDERPRYRRPQQQGMPGWALGLLVGGGGLVVLLIVFGIISGSGSDDTGVLEIRQARAYYDRDEYEAALKKLAEIDSMDGVPVWAVNEKERLRDLCNQHLEGARLRGLYNEAVGEMNKIYRFVEKHPIEVDEINRMLDRLVTRFEKEGDIVLRMKPDIDRIRKKFPRKNAGS